MSLESGFVTLVESTLTDAGYTTTLVYPHTAPQTASYPFVTYDLITDNRDKFANYSTPSDMDLQIARLELQVWAQTASGRSDIVDALRNVLHGYTGTTAGVAVRSCFIDSISHFGENDLTGTDAQIYRAVLPFDIAYRI